MCTFWFSITKCHYFWTLLILFGCWLGLRASYYGNRSPSAAHFYISACCCPYHVLFPHHSSCALEGTSDKETKFMILNELIGIKFLVMIFHTFTATVIFWLRCSADDWNLSARCTVGRNGRKKHNKKPEDRITWMVSDCSFSPRTVQNCSWFFIERDSNCKIPTFHCREKSRERLA